MSVVAPTGMELVQGAAGENGKCGCNLAGGGTGVYATETFETTKSLKVMAAECVADPKCAGFTYN